MTNRQIVRGLQILFLATSFGGLYLALFAHTARPSHLERVYVTPPRAVVRPAVTGKIPSTEAFAVPVLMYHRICDLSPKEAQSDLVRDLTVSPKDFESQVKFLSENGFTFL